LGNIEKTCVNATVISFLYLLQCCFSKICQG